MSEVYRNINPDPGDPDEQCWESPGGGHTNIIDLYASGFPVGTTISINKGGEKVRDPGRVSQFANVGTGYTEDLMKAVETDELNDFCKRYMDRQWVTRHYMFNTGKSGERVVLYICITVLLFRVLMNWAVIF